MIDALHPQEPTAYGRLSANQAQPLSVEVFLSHAKADSDHVSLVARQIEALGIKVYLAEHDSMPGTSLAQKVEDAITRCHAVVVLITTTSINSAFVQQEVGIAHSRNKPIIPIVESGIDIRKLGILQGVEYLELDLAHPSETMAKITASLQSLVTKQLLAMNVTPSGNQPSIDTAQALMLIGVGVLVGLFVVLSSTSQGNSDG